MSPGTKAFLQRWVITTVGVLVAANIVDGVHATNMVSLLGASLLLGILNAFIRPILMVAALPLVLLTLGLFTFVINAFLLYVVGSIIKGFTVLDFWSALKGAIVISIVSLIANAFVGRSETRTNVHMRRNSPPAPPRPPADTGSGPVIDV